METSNTPRRAPERRNAFEMIDAGWTDMAPSRTETDSDSDCISLSESDLLDIERAR